MKKPLKIYSPFDIIAIPFPFRDKLEQRKRPALVLSSEKFNSSSAIEISQLINNSETYSNKDIVISGEIVDVCPMKGCWIEVKDFNSNHSVRVKVKDDVIVFPENSKGNHVIASGTFTKIEFSEEKAIQWKMHLAEEKGIILSRENIRLQPSDLVEYRLNGIGAEIINLN